MRYWWVNHKQTARQELDGGYLWSPKREARGARSQFYDNMRLASPGDIVLSYSGGAVGHVGVVADFASTAPKPESFGSTGVNWSAEGWILPVVWQKLATPVRPKPLINALGPLLPAKYSPIHPISGNGNQKAYLAEIAQTVVQLLIGQLPAVTIADSDEGSTVLARIDASLEAVIGADTSLDATVKQQVVLARQGQGTFRMRIFDFESRCRLTGVANPRLLVASHVKPWRVCETANERLDGANGLLLTPHVDRLFDRGFLSFGDQGSVLLSSRLDPVDLDRLGLRAACAGNCGTFAPAQRPYLAYHRAEVFIT